MSKSEINGKGAMRVYRISSAEAWESYRIPLLGLALCIAGLTDPGGSGWGRALAIFGIIGLLGLMLNMLLRRTNRVEVRDDGTISFRGIVGGHSIDASQLTAVSTTVDEQSRSVEFTHAQGTVETLPIDDIEELLAILEALKPGLTIKREW